MDMQIGSDQLSFLLLSKGHIEEVEDLPFSLVLIIADCRQLRINGLELADVKSRKATSTIGE
jgi:hypothetical protein